MPVIIFPVCVVLMAFFNSVMDATENENFYESIFRNLNPKFWYKRESWKYNKKYFGYRFDAWHIAKSCMIICFTFALVAAYLTGRYMAVRCGVWEYLLFICNIGLLWNGCFNFFYHIIFKVK